jgi:hypothetical protein
MTIKLNGALSRWLAGAALVGLISVALIPVATARWLQPWLAAWPVAVERSLEAQGYVLRAPLILGPGVYLADVSAGGAGYQRLVIDARSGQILKRFSAPWGPGLAARDEEFGEPPHGGVEPLLSPGFSGRPATASAAKSAHGGPANVHIPATISPYDGGEAPAGAKAKARSASTDHTPPAIKLALPAINPPLPPPAPREAARLDGPGLPASRPAEKHEQDQPKIDSRPTEVDSDPPAATPTTRGLSAEANDKPKVNIVPPALFE